jgi:HD-like signal output (HDOD) protein
MDSPKEIAVVSTTLTETAPPTTGVGLAELIATKNLPAFGATLRAVTSLLDDENTSGQRLSDVILCDPALTVSVLRAANAALGFVVDPSLRIFTVSRAVVVLGMDALKALCVAALTVERIAGDLANTDKLTEVAFQAVHAATQAKNIGVQQGKSRALSEKLFVDTMLSHVGELAFWCFGAEHAMLLDEKLSVGVPNDQAELEVLGTSLRVFGNNLLKHWGLERPASQEEVDLATAFAKAAASDPAARREAAHRVASFVGKTPAEAVDFLAKGTEEAEVYAKVLGLKDISKYADRQPLPAEDVAAEGASLAYFEADPGAQINVMGEMTGLVHSQGNLRDLLAVCLEGLHRAGGLDRVAFLLFTQDRSHLVARMHIGLDASSPMKVRHDHGVEKYLSHGTVHHFHAKAKRPGWMDSSVTAEQCLVAPLAVDRKIIGLVYADRRISGRPITPEVVTGFAAFVRHFELVAHVLGMPRHGSAPAL